MESKNLTRLAFCRRSGSPFWFQSPVHRYECLNLEIYASPETCQQIKQNKAVEEVAETIRCENNILSDDYAAMVEKISWNHDIRKEYLSSAEIKQLASTPYDVNPDVYKAGMFSIYTGLRRSDILALRWENIHHDRGRKACLRFCIKKTGALVQLPLSLPAVRVLGEQQLKGKVFPMLTESILTTHVSRWVRKAKINKHITFHCFRHTFAMQLLDKGVDIYTITALLGHRQVSNTQNYAKITPKKVLEAIMKIG